jgi:hypothetical protein
VEIDVETELRFELREVTLRDMGAMAEALLAIAWVGDTEESLNRNLARLRRLAVGTTPITLVVRHVDRATGAVLKTTRTVVPPGGGPVSYEVYKLLANGPDEVP